LYDDRDQDIIIHRTEPKYSVLAWKLLIPESLSGAVQPGIC